MQILRGEARPPPTPQAVNGSPAHTPYPLNHTNNPTLFKIPSAISLVKPELSLRRRSKKPSIHAG